MEKIPDADISKMAEQRAVEIRAYGYTRNQLDRARSVYAKAGKRHKQRDVWHTTLADPLKHRMYRVPMRWCLHPELWISRPRLAQRVEERAMGMVIETLGEK